MSVNTNTTIALSATITDAEWRIFGAFLADVLEAGGVTRTADTGQINWATVAFPGTNSTSAGYEIRQFTDAMQATAPVFIKIDYRRGAAGSKTEILFTIGTGSNGSGTITGIKFTSNPCLMTSTSATYKGFVSAQSNRFAFAFENSNSGGLVGVERTVNVSKAVTDAGVLIMHYNALATTGLMIGQQYVPFSGTLPAAETSSGGSTSGGCLSPMNQTTGLHSDGNVAVYPIYFFGVGETLVPGTNFVGGFNNDFTALNQYTINVLGSDQNMIRLTTTASPVPGRGGIPSVVGHLMRYE